MPGSVWTLAATAGMGATSFAVQCAVAACRTGRVVLANGHMSSHLLGLPDPSAKDAWASMPLPGQDVLILDTLDEMWRPPEWRRTANSS